MEHRNPQICLLGLSFLSNSVDSTSSTPIEAGLAAQTPHSGSVKEAYLSSPGDGAGTSNFSIAVWNA